MTHEERLALIHRPFFITTITRSYPWSGTSTFNQWDRTVADLIADQLESDLRREMLIYLLQTEVERFDNRYSRLLQIDDEMTWATAVHYSERKAEIRERVQACMFSEMDAQATADHLGYPLSLVRRMRGSILAQRKAKHTKRAA